MKNTTLILMTTIALLLLSSCRQDFHEASITGVHVFENGPAHLKLDLKNDHSYTFSNGIPSENLSGTWQVDFIDKRPTLCLNNFAYDFKTNKMDRGKYQLIQIEQGYLKVKLVFDYDRGLYWARTS